eukprot:s1336_g4.t1
MTLQASAQLCSTPFQLPGSIQCGSRVKDTFTPRICWITAESAVEIDLGCGGQAAIDRFSVFWPFAEPTPREGLRAIMQFPACGKDQTLTKLQ